jgi:hypothetical protein
VIRRELEGDTLGAGMHLPGELPRRDLVAEVDHVATKLGPVDLVVIDLDDSIIFCILLVWGAGTEEDGRE